MKVVQNAYSFGIYLNEARRLTEDEKAQFTKEACEHMLYSTGIEVKLQLITWKDIVIFQHRESYSFPGCGNVCYEISDSEWDSLIELNNKRVKASHQKEVEDEIARCRYIIAEAEKQADIPTVQEAHRRMRQYNNLHNEGGYGYVPIIYSEEDYQSAKERLEHLLPQIITD